MYIYKIYIYFQSISFSCKSECLYYFNKGIQIVINNIEYKYFFYFLEIFSPSLKEENDESS